MISRTPALLGLIGAIALAPTLHSQTVLFDSQGFNAPTYTTGALVGQNGWSRDGAGAPQIVDIGGNRYVSAPGGSNGWFFPSINHTPAANEIVVVEARIARSLGTTPASTSSFAFAIDVYPTSGARIARTGLMYFNDPVEGPQIWGFVSTRYNTITNQFDPLASAQNIIRTDPLVANQFYEFQMLINFSTKTFSVSLDGFSIGENMPFVNLGAASLGDADFQVSSNAGANDQGFLDDYVVYTTLIPEPSAAAGLAGLAAIGLAATRRRRRVCA